MKTEDLENNLYLKLDTLGFNVYDTEAKKDAQYPYIVYNFRRVDFGNEERKDYILDIDVWDENTNYSRVNSIGDNIQKLLSNLNNPDEKVLATYYIENREKILDENKRLKRIQLEFNVQNYFL